MSRKAMIFESKERMSRERVAGFLHELADKVRDNEVVFRHAGEAIAVELPAELVLEVELDVKRKDGGVERSLEIELEWREGEAGGVSLA